jgi:hypothetical protein
MVELLDRERETMLGTWEITMVAQGLMHGQSPDASTKVAHMLRKDLAKYVYQTASDPRELLARLQDQLTGVRKEKHLLEKTAKMTAGWGR